MKKRILSMLLVIVLVLSMAPMQALADGETVTITAPASAMPKTLSVYGTMQLHAEVPATTEDKSVTWSTDSTAVTVDSATGVVTGKKAADKVIVKATDSKGGYGTIELKVIPALTITGTTNIAPGETTTLTAQTLSDFGTTLHKWSSNKPAMISVTNGVVKAESESDVDGWITAYYGNGEIVGKVKISVKKPVVEATNIVLSKTSVSLVVGSDGETVKATVKPDGTSDKTLSWVSGNTGVATVEKKDEQNALIKPVAPGDTSVTVTCGSITKTIDVHVDAKPVPVETITITGKKNLVRGGEMTLTAEVLPAEATNKALEWTMTPATVGTLIDGKIQLGVTAPVGDVVVTATAKDGSGVKGEFTFKVTLPALKDFTLSKDTVALTASEGNYDIVKVTSFDPSDAKQKTVTWESQDTSVATVEKVDDVTVKILPVAPGETTVVATCGKIQKNVTVKVSAQYVAVSGVTITGGQDSIVKGNSMQLQAQVSPNNATDKTVTWSMNPATSGNISPDGLVTVSATAPNGPITVTATCGSKSDTFTFTVVDPTPVTKVVISQEEGLSEVAVGKTLQLKATVIPAGATDPTLTWKSSDESVATVDQDGLVTAKSASNKPVTITAVSKNNKKGTFQVTVTPSKTIVVTEPKPTATLVAGRSLTPKAQVVNANGKVTTDTVSWRLVNQEEGITFNGTTLMSRPDLQLQHTVQLEATAPGTDAKPVVVSVDVVPAPQSVELRIGGELVNNQNYVVDLEDSSIASGGIVISAFVKPDNARQKVRWEISDPGSICTDRQWNADLQLTPVAALKTGTVTVKAYDGEGTGVFGTVTIRFSKLGQGITLSTPKMLRGGAKLDLSTLTKLANDPLDKTIVWSVTDASGNKTSAASTTTAGMLKTKVVTAPTQIKVTATIKATGEKDTKTITLYPVTKSITITGAPTKLEYQNGMVYNLAATVEPAANSVWDLEWSSSNPTVAKVDSKTGKLEILDAGSTLITCKIADGSNKKGSLTITVTKTAGKVYVTSSEGTEILSGQHTDMTAEVISKKGVLAANQKVTWEIQDTSGNATDIATITSAGRLTAKEVKKDTKIVVIATSVEDPTISGKITLTIKPNAAKTLHIFVNGQRVDSALTMALDDTATLDAKWFNADGTKTKAKDCTFVSGRGDRVSIADGVMTAEATGTSVITASCVDPDSNDMFTTTIEVEVVEEIMDVKSVTIDIGKTNYLRSGKSTRIRAYAWTDLSGYDLADNQDFTWKVYDTNPAKDSIYATIDENGTLTALDVQRAHTVTVVAISDENGMSKEATVHILPAERYLYTFTWNGNQYTDTITMDVDDKAAWPQLHVYATVEDKNGSFSVYDGNVTVNTSSAWGIEDTDTVEITASGLKALAIGTTGAGVRGTGTDGNTYQTTVSIVVTQRMGAIELKQDGILVAKKNRTMQMRAVSKKDATDQTVTWTVDDHDGGKRVVINENTGLLTAKKKLTTSFTIDVTATPKDGSASVTETITVYPPTTKVYIKDNGVAVNGKIVKRLLSERNASFKATAEPTDAFNLSFYWTSSNEDIATVDQYGNVTFKKAGTVVIKATSLDGTGKKAQFRLRITN